jgi:TolB-like protein/tetratricopeptide (TPR) repeat protein
MPLLPSSRLGPYEIVELIAAGGMGEVYSARDVRLERAVAIKVLPPTFASDPDRLRRFEQEARAVAAVSHPNVLAVFDVGAGEVPYIVTELLDGETLRAALARGPFSPRAAIDVVMQVVSGLAAAHARGLVHRDLKPENILITRDGMVKVLDFGLAKPLAGSSDVRTELQTETGITVGTAGYMSPEQARGSAVDQRADIFAVGAILYELIAGSRAFAGRSSADIITAVLREEPPDLAERHEAGAGLARIVRRCLEKDAARRFQTAAELKVALESLADSDGATLRRPEAAAGGKTIAVLPFTNLSADADNEFFSDGLTEEIIADLARIRALRVTSRTSAMQFKGTRKDVRTIGRELGVRYVVEGSVRKAGHSLRITALLIDSHTDAHLWADKYSGTFDDVFALQERVSREIVRALDVTLTSDEDRSLARRSITDPRAFELYLQARQEIRRMGGGPERGMTLLARAVEIEGPSAPLRAWIGWATVAQVKAGINRDGRLLDEAEAHARAVFAMSPESPLGYAVLGYAEFERGRLEEAVRNFRLALRYEPNESDVLFYLCLSYVYSGCVDRAAEVSRELLACDPLAGISWMLPGVIEWFAGRFAAAAAPIQRALSLDPDNYIARWTLAYSFALTGRLAELEEQTSWLERAGPTVPYTLQMRALVDALNGNPARGVARLAAVDAAHLDQHLLFHLAEPYALAGDVDRALDLLARAVDGGFYPVDFIASHAPFFVPVRAQPRFQAIVADARRRSDAFRKWDAASI